MKMLMIASPKCSSLALLGETGPMTNEKRMLKMRAPTTLELVKKSSVCPMSLLSLSSSNTFESQRRIQVPFILPRPITQCPARAAAIAGGLPERLHLQLRSMPLFRFRAELYMGLRARCREEAAVCECRICRVHFNTKRTLSRLSQNA